MKRGDRSKSGVEMTPAPSVISKHTPVLEPCERVLDTSTPSTMTAPRTIPHDAVSAEDRRDELWYAAIAAIGEDAAMILAQSFDGRASVVDRIIAIARTAGRRRNDVKIAPSHQDLRVAAPPIVLRPCGVGVIARRKKRAVDDPRLSAIGPACEIDRRQLRRQCRDDAMHR